MIMASVLAAHLAAALALFNVPAFQLRGGTAGEWAFAVLGWGLLLVSLARGLLAQHRLRGRTIWLEDDGTLEMLMADRGPGLHRVLPGSQVVLAAAVWFALVPLVPPESGIRGQTMRLMLVPDNLVGKDFRHLRAWLLHRAGRPLAAPGAS